MKAYLDNSATTRPSDGVIETMAACMRDGFYNPSSQYAPAVNSQRELRACRETILKCLRGSDERVIFTSGGTEANNLAILGSVERMRGKQIVAVSSVEHPSVQDAFEKLRDLGHDVRIIGVDAEGNPDWDALQKALDDGASLVSMMQVNNETGAMLDVERLYRMVHAKENPALIHVDGVQGFLRVPLDIRYVDMYTLSGHKIHAPKGIAALVCRKNVRLVARQIGGGQEDGLRSGTENTPGIAGLKKATEEMTAMGSSMAADLMAKKLHLVEAFREAVPEMMINGPKPEDGAPHIVNISFPNVRGEVMLHALEAEGVYASTGSACSSKKLKVSRVLVNMGISPERAEWALRFSLSPYTTMEEIDHAAEVLKKNYALLKRFRRR